MFHYSCLEVLWKESTATSILKCCFDFLWSVLVPACWFCLSKSSIEDFMVKHLRNHWSSCIYLLYDHTWNMPARCGILTSPRTEMPWKKCKKFACKLATSKCNSSYEELLFDGFKATPGQKIRIHTRSAVQVGPQSLLLSRQFVVIPY